MRPKVELAIAIALFLSAMICLNAVPLAYGKGYSAPLVPVPVRSPQATLAPTQQPQPTPPRNDSPTPVVRRVPSGDGGSVDSGLAVIRNCESHGQYATNTGNGYYGAYQYDVSTWNGYGGYRTANLAPPSLQDQRARQDYPNRHQKWPACSRGL